MSNGTQVLQCISISASRLLSNSVLMHPKNGKVLDRCALARKQSVIVSVYHATPCFLVSLWGIGETIESPSDCVSVCRGWHDFVAEYWTSPYDLRQKRIVQWHPADREGRLHMNFCAQHIKVSHFFFWMCNLFEQMLDIKNLHSISSCEPKPPRSFEYGSPMRPQLLEGLSGNRCVPTPHLARHWDLINVGEERHHRGDGDTCHHSNTGWSVTDKCSPWDMNLLPIPPTEMWQEKWERQRGNIPKGHNMQKKKFVQSLRVGFSWSHFLTDVTTLWYAHGFVPIMNHKAHLKDIWNSAALLVMLHLDLMFLFSSSWPSVQVHWKLFFPYCHLYFSCLLIIIMLNPHEWMSYISAVKSKTFMFWLKNKAVSLPVLWCRIFQFSRF